MTTVRELLTGVFRGKVMDLGDLDLNIEDYRLYVFWHGSTALYVGQSKNALKRVEEHLGLGLGLGTTTMGRLLEANYPSAYEWPVWFVTVGHATEMWRKWAWDSSRVRLAREPTVNDAEGFLIRYYQPCLNIAHRSGKRHLPDGCLVPRNEFPDGLTLAGGDLAPLRAYRVSYRAFDWREVEAKEYGGTVRASGIKICRGLVIQFLGFVPDALRIDEVIEVDGRFRFATYESPDELAHYAAVEAINERYKVALDDEIRDEETGLQLPWPE